MHKLSLSMVFILVMAAYCYAGIVTIGVGDWVDIREDINDNFTEVSTSTWGESDPFMIVAPDNIYAVVGVESNVFFDNLVKEYAGVNLINWDVSDSDDEATGVHEIARWTDTPSDITDDGNVLTFSVYDTSGSSRDTQDITYNVAPASSHGYINMLWIGDSTSPDTLMSDINDFDTADANLTISWIGTQNTPRLNEAYSGKTLDWFYSHADSPFTKADVFDYSAYLTDNTLNTPDLVVIQLGINDLFSRSTDATVAVLAAANIVKLEAMVTAIQTENTGAKVFINLVSLPSDQDDMGSDYDSGQTSWRMKRNAQLYNKALLDNDWDYGVLLLGTSLNIDTTTDMTNGVHPDASGYQAIADVFYACLKNKLPTWISYHDSRYSAVTRLTTTDNFEVSDGSLTVTTTTTGFHGGAVTFKANKKTSYTISAEVVKGADTVSSTSVGILLWNGSTAVTYDLPDDSDGQFNTFVGNLNYFSTDEDAITIDCTIDLSAAPDFDHISLHFSGYTPGGATPGEYGTLDLSSVKIVAQ